MTGKRGTAPCGHPGTHVTTNYVACDLGCDSIADGVPIEVDPEETLPLCPGCRSGDVEATGKVDICGNVAWRCLACGGGWS